MNPIWARKIAGVKASPALFSVNFWCSILFKNILVYSVCSASKEQRRNEGFELNILNIMFSLITRTVTHGFIVFFYNLFKTEVFSTVWMIIKWLWFNDYMLTVLLLKCSWNGDKIKGVISTPAHLVDHPVFHPRPVCVTWWGACWKRLEAKSSSLCWCRFGGGQRNRRWKLWRELCSL